MYLGSVGSRQQHRPFLSSFRISLIQRFDCYRYGPVWIATTVVVILFLTGTISQYLAHNGKDHFAYDFKLLSGGAGLIYGYTGLVPVALWGVLKWFGSEHANLLECMALYGYANLIWIPVALISWSPISSKWISPSSVPFLFRIRKKLGIIAGELANRW